MKITIITVCYNAVNVLEKTICSVLNQSYKNIEYIIIDGKSTDGTLNIIKKYDTYITRWTSEPDKGIFDAMNKGVSYSHGNSVLFLNSGDYLCDEFVISRCFENCQYNDCSVIYGDVYQDYISKKRYYKECPFYLSKKKIRGMGICHQALFVRGDIIRNLRFDLSYKCCADYNMMMQIYKSGGRFLSLNIPIAVYDTLGFSEIHWKRVFYEEARICEVENSVYYKIVLYKRIIFRCVRKCLGLR